MEGDPRIDKLMLPVLAAIDRHVKDSDAKTEIYNRAYEALLESMDALDASAKVTAKQIAENAKNLQRAEAAEAKVAELEAAQEWIPVTERLPEIGFVGLCQVAGNGYTIARYAPYDSLAGWTSDEYGYCAVTHYMPLPQPPKPEDDIRHG